MSHGGTILESIYLYPILNIDNLPPQWCKVWPQNAEMTMEAFMKGFTLWMPLPDLSPVVLFKNTIVSWLQNKRRLSTSAVPWTFVIYSHRWGLFAWKCSSWTRTSRHGRNTLPKAFQVSASATMVSSVKAVLLSCAPMHSSVVKNNWQICSNCTTSSSCGFWMNLFKTFRKTDGN